MPARSTLAALRGRRRRPRPRAGCRRGHPVCAVRPGGLPVRPARGTARPHRRRPGHGDAERQARRRLQQPDRHGRGRAGRRPGPGSASRRTEFASILGPLARHPRPAGLRPARHRQLGPAHLPGLRPWRHVDRRCRGGVRQPARAGARLLPHSRTRSTTSRRSASSPATRSSSSSASPTAPRSRSTTPPSTRPTSSRSVLDSVVPPEGSDVLNVSTFKTMPRALGELCSAAGATASRRASATTSSTSCTGWGASRSAERSTRPAATA